MSSAVNPKDLGAVRQLLSAHKQDLMRRYSAQGVAVGKDQQGDHVIVVYLDAGQAAPPGPVLLEGVHIRFEVTGKFRPQ